MAGEKSIELIQEANPFINGPGDFLCRHIAKLIGDDPKWKLMFGDNIDAYERFDYSMRSLPCLRIYNLIYNKQHESHYILGEIHADVVLPPSLRRQELQVVQDLFASAMMQQFRRPSFFDALRAVVPGLNELGKTFDVDKESGLVYEEEILPLCRMTLNFRLDLKEWDAFLEGDCRTKDQPFDRTLGELTRIVGIIKGEDDQEVTNVEIGLDTKEENGS